MKVTTLTAFISDWSAALEFGGTSTFRTLGRDEELENETRDRETNACADKQDNHRIYPGSFDLIHAKHDDASRAKKTYRLGAQRQREM